MTDRRYDARAKAHWLKYNYPLTIIADRYGGTYSGGVFLALPLGFGDIPHEIAGSDPDCAQFWDTTNADDRLIPCGRGNTPQEAYEDLRKRMGQEG